MNSQDKIEVVIENTQSYIESSIELLKLKAGLHASNLLATMFTNLLISVILSLLLFFASVGVAIYISQLLKIEYAGFFLVAGFYLVIFVVFYLGKNKWIPNYFRDKIIAMMFNPKSINIKHVEKEI